MPSETVQEHIAFWQRYKRNMDFTYVLQGRPEAPIKIGHGDPESRLRAAQTGNWEDLKLLYVMPGGEELEREFHYRLRNSRVRGEWFGDPGKAEFLEWIPTYVEGVKRHFEKTGEIPPPPLTRKQDPSHAPKQTGANIVHRWRMSQQQESTLTLRWVEPEPTPPDERRKREERAFMGFTRTSDDSNPVSSPEGTSAGSVPG